MNATQRKQPFIIELLGPPGSGKSTVSSILQKQNNEVSIEIFPYFRQAKNLPFFAINLIRLFPDLLKLLWQHPGRRFVNGRDIALMTVLTGWDASLQQMAKMNGKAIILEEGAICLLGKLSGFGSEAMRSDSLAGWRQKTYSRWGRTLDFVILLETPIPVLLQRVRARGVQYEIGSMADEEACRYLERIKQSQDEVLSRIIAMPKAPKIIRIDAHNNSPEQISAIIRAGLGT
jgi:adenylate kinase family enzyme